MSSVPRNSLILRLELLVDVLGAADEADAAHAVAVRIERRPGRLEHLWMGAQPQIVVRAEVDHLTRRVALGIDDPDVRALGRQNLSFLLVESSFVNLRYLPLQRLPHCSVHDASLSARNGSKIEPALTMALG